MATFLTFIEIQPEHRAEVTRNFDERFEEAVELVESNGGEVKDVYFGNIAGYDAMTVTEFPDRESIERADILYNMDPAIDADVTRVHPSEEYAQLIGEAVGE
ncbi:GYD domain-containing protein [Halobellus sp. EA9]|uniref:GYD domain-containing protein n=1 Tax=Halobellus sp. EA9 TaxID=3421647 RepID=UPI003EBBF3EF